MDRAHIQNGVKIREYNGERGRITLATGDTASPIVIGYENGDDKVLAIESEMIDNSISTHFTTSATVEIIEASRLLKRTTISDMALEDARAKARTEVQAKADIEADTPFEHNGLQVRPEELDRVLGADLNPNPNRKRTIRGFPITADAQAVTALKNSYIAHEDAVGLRANTLATSVAAAGSLADLDEVIDDLQNGWPSDPG